MVDSWQKRSRRHIYIQKAHNSDDSSRAEAPPYVIWNQTIQEVTKMNIPTFTADASLYKTRANYRMCVSGFLERGLHMQVSTGITAQPFECELVCERVFENGISFERCRIECPEDGSDGGVGGSLDCRARCREMGLPQSECLRLCLGQP